MKKAFGFLFPNRPDSQTEPEENSITRPALPNRRHGPSPGRRQSCVDLLWQTDSMEPELNKISHRSVVNDLFLFIKQHCNSDEENKLCSRLRDWVKQATISRAPNSVLLEILSFCSVKALYKCAIILNRNTDEYDETVWKNMCVKAGLPNRRPDFVDSWKRFYEIESAIHEAWTTGHGERKEKHCIKLNTHEYIVTGVMVYKTYIIVSLDLCDVYVYSMSDKRHWTLRGHTFGVWSLGVVKEYDLFVTASVDNTLMVWSLASGMVLRTLFGHTATVRCLATHRTTIVSGGRDQQVRLWDALSGGALHVMAGHTDAVRSVVINELYAASASYDNRVFIWRVADGTLHHTIDTHTDKAYALRLHRNMLVHSSHDSTVQAHDMDTLELVNTYRGNAGFVHLLHVNDWMICGSASDGSTRIWDARTACCEHTILAPSEVIAVDMACYGDWLVVATTNAEVNLFHIKSGKLVRRLWTGSHGDTLGRVTVAHNVLVVAYRNAGNLFIERTYLDPSRAD